MLPSGLGVIFCRRVLTKSNGRLQALAKKPRGTQRAEAQHGRSKHSQHRRECWQGSKEQPQTTPVCQYGQRVPTAASVVSKRHRRTSQSAPACKNNTTQQSIPASLCIACPPFEHTNIPCHNSHRCSAPADQCAVPAMEAPPSTATLPCLAKPAALINHALDNNPDIDPNPTTLTQQCTYLQWKRHPAQPRCRPL